MTLAFEDANSKLPHVVSVADIDAQERFDNRLVLEDFESNVW